MKKFLLLILPFILLSITLFNFLPSSEANSNVTLFKVTSVVDGDTIKANIRGKIETIRLLGIDTPETVDPRKPVQCFGKAASDKMKSFVLGKSVILIDDSTQGNRDKYNRLLRYVYLPNSVRTFVNGEMVKQGYAFSYRQYPTKLLTRFNAWEKYARENNLGLWGSCQLSPTPTIIKKIIAPTSSNTYIPPVQNYTAPVQQNSNGSYACDCSKSCTAISSCDEAYYQLNTCGCSARDGDKDGIPCESLCK